MLVTEEAGVGALVAKAGIGVAAVVCADVFYGFFESVVGFFYSSFN